MTQTLAFLVAADCTVSYPTDWTLVDKGSDFALALRPQKDARSDDAPLVTVQVPKLPPHIPGFLPIGSVAGGYVDDLRKRFPDEKIDEQTEAKLDGANARRLVSSFQDDGKPSRELALLAVRGDHVYVITGTGSAEQFDETKQVFDSIVSSWRWRSK